MKKLFLPLIMILFILTAGFQASSIQTEIRSAPDFALKDLQGNLVDLASYKGKVLFLNFWATWCPPCRAEIPGFIEAYKTYKDKGLEILGISFDRKSPENLLAIVNNIHINYPVALATPKIVEDYEPGDAIPATIIIDRAGKIRQRHIGLLSKEMLIKFFKEFGES